MKNKIKRLFRKLYYLRSFMAFKKVGKNLTLSKAGKFIRPNEIEFGNNVFINYGFYISARNLHIGNDVMIGPRLTIECDDHIYDVVGCPMIANANNRKGEFVRIESDVWIGANVTVLKNVIIGEGAVIGAGSVVTKNIPPYTIALGIPCKPYKIRFTAAQLKMHLNSVQTSMTYEQVCLEWQKYNLK